MACAASFYDIVEKDIRGENVDFSQFRGRVVYGLNVASRCGFTQSEYARLRSIGEQHKSDDLSILAYPSGQYANQECTTNEEIMRFAQENGPAGMLVLSKGDVKGKKQRPTYEWLAANCPGIDRSWNFRAKFLVDRAGNPSPTTRPEEDIPALLRQ
ncbi:putative phospholipid hydroperoxide glutathione peroxidase 6 [Diplonema papillatum]|nr:putative phospholipid hydroperoxide glutathione peroxidase 6 [Diplonema papillatum]